MRKPSKRGPVADYAAGLERAAKVMDAEYTRLVWYIEMERRMKRRLNENSDEATRAQGRLDAYAQIAGQLRCEAGLARETGERRTDVVGLTHGLRLSDLETLAGGRARP